MRHILVDHACIHAAVKRGGTPIHLSTDEIEVLAIDGVESILVIDEVLGRLEKLDERQSKIVDAFFRRPDNPQDRRKPGYRRTHGVAEMAGGKTLALSRA